jgi:hypothetical protein
MFMWKSLKYVQFMSCLFFLLHLKLYSLHYVRVSWFMPIVLQPGIMCQVSPGLLLLELHPWLDPQSAWNCHHYSITKTFFNRTITIAIIKTLCWLMYYSLISNNTHTYTIMITLIALNVSEHFPACHVPCVHFSPDNVRIQNSIIWNMKTQKFTQLIGMGKIYTELSSEAFMVTWCK